MLKRLIDFIRGFETEITDEEAEAIVFEHTEYPFGTEHKNMLAFLRWWSNKDQDKDES